MSLGIDLWKDFGGFWMPKWSSNCSQMESKFDMDRQTQIFMNWSFHCRIYSRIWFTRMLGRWILGSKINKKSIPKWCRTGKASGHRFICHVGEFWLPEWSPKSVKKLSKMCLEMDTAPRRLQKLLEAARSSNNRFPVGFSEAREGRSQSAVWRVTPCLAP